MNEMKYTPDRDARDVVVSVRVRLARNLADIPFPTRGPWEERADIADKIRRALEGKDFIFTDMASLGATERSCYVESRNISPEFASGEKGTMLITSKKDPHLFVMINEEDHIRIQGILDRMSPEEALKSCMEFDDALEEAFNKASLSIAFDKDMGYLTCCPSNIGCGLRASAMLHLPALNASGKISALADALGKLGYNLRGSYGEGSESKASLYQISNRSSKGKSEEEIINEFTRVTNEVIETERKERASLLKRSSVSLTDSIMRSYGIMRYARKVTSKELTELYSNVRLGRAILGEELPSFETLDRLAVELMPAHLALSDRSADDAYARDVIRADKMRLYMAQTEAKG